MAVDSRYVSTSKASRILGVSTTLIKSLVDEHKLQAWKTQGGHRRILLDSIDDYLSSFQPHKHNPNSAALAHQETVPRKPAASLRAAPAVLSPATPRITVAVQTPQLLSSIRTCLERVVHADAMSLPRVVASPAQALREITHGQPNILVLEMAAPLAEQEQTLALLGGLAPDGPPVSVLVVTQNPGLKLPPLPANRCCVHVFSGPASLEWTHGCLSGMLTLLTSLQWRVPGAGDLP